MIILPISDTTFSIYYFKFIENILYLFPQVFNVGKLISQKHNSMDINWKTNQGQPQATGKLGESVN